jgi:hypothetical protein
MQEIDTRVVDPLRDFLFGAPGDVAMDLASLNIQRGRDNGLSSYNDTSGAAVIPRLRNVCKDSTIYVCLADC